MKKIEHVFDRMDQFIDDFSWVFYVLVGCLWVFWATQAGGPLYNGMRQEMARERVYQAGRTMESDRRDNMLYHTAAGKLIDRAHKLGRKYSPKQYFADLKEIDKLERRYPRVAFAQSEITDLQELSWANSRMGLFTENEIIKAREDYKHYREDVLHEVPDRAMENWMKAHGWLGLILAILKWVLIFFFRSMPLALILYLMRMAAIGRKGILATILADKLRFAAAIIAWPYFISRYPHNVVREIVVEAELRRIGKVFRFLSREEKAIVREVAARDTRSYSDWRFRFHTRHATSFERTLIVSIFLTLTFMVLAPFLGKASGEEMERQRGSPHVAMCAVDWQNLGQHSANDNSNSAPDYPTLSANFPLILHELVSWFEKIEQKVQGLILIKAVEHIPISLRLFGAVTAVIK